MLPRLALADAVDDWIAAQPEHYRSFLDSVKASKRLMRYTDACPADVFSTWGARAKGTVECKDNPGWCLIRCKLGSGDACFGAGYVVDTELDHGGDSDLAFPLFMAACADGNANGCVNAGANAKNGSWTNPRPAMASSRDCQFRTYQISCGVGAAWGCFMLGLEWGVEGVDGQVDLPKARTAWERSCTLQPSGSACNASRSRLERYAE